MSNNNTNPPLIVNSNSYSYTRTQPPPAVKPETGSRDRQYQQASCQQRPLPQIVSSQIETNEFATASTPLPIDAYSGHKIVYPDPQGGYSVPLQIPCPAYSAPYQAAPPYCEPNQPPLQSSSAGLPARGHSPLNPSSIPGPYYNCEIPPLSPGAPFQYTSSPVSPHSSAQHQYFDRVNSQGHGQTAAGPDLVLRPHQTQQYGSAPVHSPGTEQYMVHSPGPSNQPQHQYQYHTSPYYGNCQAFSPRSKARSPSGDGSTHSSLRNKTAAAVRASQRSARPRMGHRSGSPITATSIDSPDGVRPNFIMGPPLKPKQSGYAVWIGNLPVKAELMDLVSHVCNITDGLESLFLISKSNCAFANFKNETCWNNALKNIHDSEFLSIRLVARQRRTGTDTPSSTTLGGLDVSSTSFGSSEMPGPTAAEEPSPSLSKVDFATIETSLPESRKTAKNRFFVLKSLTVEDLELSVKTEVWATQSHNEEALKEAFEQAENVYLMFSANKSGEYFGYARMTSPLNEDPQAAVTFSSINTQSINVGVPLPSPRPSIGRVPNGQVVSDLIRGTTFWEIQDHDGREETKTTSGRSPASHDQAQVDEVKALGKPFKLKWLSTRRVPFHHTKGMLNAWNGNRDIKIARDGTEIEPSAGFKLMTLFTEVEQKASKSGESADPGSCSGITFTGKASEAINSVTEQSKATAPPLVVSSSGYEIQRDADGSIAESMASLRI
ncbi:Zinc finger CCCH domain-containing protein 45 [Ceratocystis fimbriata CBS 114723]|uniref:Zinc finger CCCH domain-containing protein 45 n=1 Tax=Ceratocystis fimbriata CBS 114723 TaxID=1035309 RepID=A0A2C5XJP9_9PEZI|nr:Zinc finger CCCH domain-containing protein 45 [Ceratocystis fimbriata CBS 114723]